MIPPRIELDGFVLDITLRAARHGQWLNLPLARNDRGFVGELPGIRAELAFLPLPPGEGRGEGVSDVRTASASESPLTLTLSQGERGPELRQFALSFQSEFKTRLRLWIKLLDQRDFFHLIPGNIFGDNNAAHVRPGEFPVLARDRLFERNRSPLWEFRADRASHPVSILCCPRGAAGVSIDPYSDCDEADEKFIRNGVFAALPDSLGVSLGYGNDPLTFVEKTSFAAATADLCHAASARGLLYACAGEGRREVHRIIRVLYEQIHERPKHQKTHSQALRALADAFAEVNFSHELGQYSNRSCKVPIDTDLNPWRAVVEIGWTGGSMLAYPFMLAERIFTDLKLPKRPAQIFDEICSGYSDVSGFFNDTTLNRSTTNRPEHWNASDINGWWSGFLPQTKDNHCAYTNAQAAYYLLRAWEGEAPAEAGARAQDAARQESRPPTERCKHWISTALRVLDSAIALQRNDGAFGYIFSSREKRVIDFEGFAGCWFVPGLLLAWKQTNDERYRIAADRAVRFYATFVRDLSCWGAPMDTYKSVDSEGNLAFIRAARMFHEITGEDDYLEMLRDGAHYEYLWRYGFRTRPQCPPLKGSSWNSCGGSITSVSNPHIHPMSVIATGDLEYLARITGDGYHQSRADDGLAWLMNTMELYPDVMGYGRYGVLSERTCPSDGLLAERYHDGTNAPASTWWSYNAWAAGSASEALAEKLLAEKASDRSAP